MNTVELNGHHTTSTNDYPSSNVNKAYFIFVFHIFTLQSADADINVSLSYSLNLTLYTANE